MSKENIMATNEVRTSKAGLRSGRTALTRTAQRIRTTPATKSHFETDISESDEVGTIVRQSEVREDDLSEVKPSEQQGE
jgi:hypothetical protein